MTPPNAVGYANGIAQSIVSLARCVGPVIGGYVSSKTLDELHLLTCITNSYGRAAFKMVLLGTRLVSLFVLVSVRFL